MPRFVCILGIGRMGSNHLSEVLSCIPEIDSRAELFNPRRCYHLHRHELTELSRMAGEGFEPSNESQEALRTVRGRPGLVLDCLSSLMAPGKRVISFKILTSHLKLQQIEREIIGRADTIIVFLRRRPVDVFISRKKADHLQRWRDIDTTHLKVEIDAAEFLRWWRRRATWYARLEAECWYRRKPLHRLTYEDDIAGSPAEAARRFCAMLERCGITGFTFPDTAQITGLERQDRSASVADRVSNWPEFQRSLETMGELDKALAPFPHFRPNASDRLRRWLFGARLAGRRRLSAPIEAHRARHSPSRQA